MITFRSTGEVRPPKKDEYFLAEEGAGVVQATRDFEIMRFVIMKPDLSCACEGAD